MSTITKIFVILFISICLNQSIWCAPNSGSTAVENVKSDTSLSDIITYPFRLIYNLLNRFVFRSIKIVFNLLAILISGVYQYIGTRLSPFFGSLYKTESKQ